MIKLLRALDSRLGGNLLFMVLMAFGAGLSLVRGFGAAVILAAEEFGLYALLVAAAAFVSSIAGFGKIEETRKLFPRLAVDGHSGDIAITADRLAWLVALRLALIAIPICLAGTVMLPQSWIVAIFAVPFLVFGIAWATILASAMRADPNLTKMGTSAAARAAVTIILVLGGAHEFGFAGAVCGEAAGALLGCALMRYYLNIGMFDKPNRSRVLESKEQMISKSGLYFFFGSLATAAPIYLGRFLVGMEYSDKILGTYSFLGLLVTSTLTVIGISDQMTGPRFVKNERRTDQRRSQMIFFNKVIFFNVCLILILCFLFFTIVFYLYYFDFRKKYDVRSEFIIPLTLYCVFQLTSTIDWFLQAHDRERRIAIAAIVQMIVFLAASLVAIAINASVIWILWIHAMAKGMQLIVQCSFLIARPAISEPRK